ncbi:MAG: TIGR00730 family Rossman fold protein [Alphaproteobacteria bacterium]|nr:TIGR00730 family Rossman fold protein [Alphaproteobacteria bacterium]MBN2674901.1 TIGR00730 family Rossman fold protein [Alphaproteobacteria bacterium]
MKSIAVYCGHQFGTDPDYARDAANVGELLAKNNIRLVFGGGNVGLMGTIATASIKNGGDVIGVSTHHVAAMQEPVHEGVAVEIVDGVNERKQRMFELSDAFCILPGGIGTLNELTDIMTMQQIGESKKPIFFLNTNDYWNIFGRILVHMQHKGFIADMKDYDIQIASTPEDLIGLILKRNNLVA